MTMEDVPTTAKTRILVMSAIAMMALLSGLMATIVQVRLLQNVLLQHKAGHRLHVFIVEFSDFYLYNCDIAFHCELVL